MGFNLLLIDGNDIERRAVARAIRDTGLECTLQEADSIETAIDACRDTQFDCVLMDYDLPDGDGLMFGRRVQEHLDGELATVYLTGEDSEDDEFAASMALQLGSAEFLCKQHVHGPIVKRAINYAIARRNFLTELNNLGQYDPITRLPNRSLFTNMLDRAISKATRNDATFGLLILDLDRFKDINDTLGHSFGDELLQHVSQRLEHNVRRSDFVSRLGADEFAIIAEDVPSSDSIETLARNLIQSLPKRFNIAGHMVTLSASAGIAMFPSDGENAEQLLKNADLALNKAKEDGRAQHRFFDEALHQRARERREIETDLFNALENRQLRLYYQPKLDCNSGQVVGAEALLRWEHPERGLMLPPQFIQIAEDSQLIHPLGEWVIETVCQQMHDWRAQGLPVVPCSINISPTQLESGDLLRCLANAASQFGVQPSSLELEVPEGVTAGNLDRAKTQIERLREAGFRMLIDDFGADLASLSLLRKLPLDGLKIDMAFVHSALQDRNDAEVVSAVIGLAKKLNLQVTAVGVETENQFDLMCNQGSDIVQGHYFSQALPADIFAAWFRTRLQREQVAIAQ
jgi:diguanylate cyclase (GGDEF)-like protein